MGAIDKIGKRITKKRYPEAWEILKSRLDRGNLFNGVKNVTDFCEPYFHL